jgi:hypothetical protein
MKPEPLEAKKDFGKDLKTFEQACAKTKELELLKDQDEKASGQERVSLDKKIQDKSGSHPATHTCLIRKSEYTA